MAEKSIRELIGDYVKAKIVFDTAKQKMDWAHILLRKALEAYDESGPFLVDTWLVQYAKDGKLEVIQLQPLPDEVIDNRLD